MGTSILGSISGMHSCLVVLLELTGPPSAEIQQWRNGCRYCQCCTPAPHQGFAAAQSLDWSHCTPPPDRPHPHDTPPQQALWGRPSPPPADTGQRTMTRRKKKIAIFQLPLAHYQIILLYATACWFFNATRTQARQCWVYKEAWRHIFFQQSGIKNSTWQLKLQLLRRQTTVRRNQNTVGTLFLSTFNWDLALNEECLQLLTFSSLPALTVFTIKAILICPHKHQAPALLESQNQALSTLPVLRNGM